MNISRRDFFTILGAGTAAAALPGCCLPKCGPRHVNAKIALQLYSIGTYIAGKKDKDGKVIVPGVGLERALENLAAIGFKGVEFAGYYGFDAKALKKMLADNGMNIADNCVRTWFFVRDIDCNYNGVVVGRRENFLQNGLTPDTHYIASTGIEGKYEDHKVLSILDAYAVKNIPTDKIQILYAAENMNKTIEYGVTFERGVCVHHSGYKQIYISGTASIDTKGDVLHIGDIKGQVRRMTENVNALLVEAGCKWDDIAQATVYLRDIADYEVAYNELSKIMPDGQFIIVQAPVCRPTWLIEMEAIAIGKE